MPVYKRCPSARLSRFYPAGGLGWALKKTSCALKYLHCSSCLIKEQCAYAWIFETEQYKNGNGHAVNARPHPFIIQPVDQGESKKRGETFSFSMLLIERAVDMLPILIYAIRFMGESGIGSGTRRGMGRFVLEEVKNAQETVYSAADNTVCQPQGGQVNPIELSPVNGEHPQTVTVTMQTPLRLKQKNRLQQDLPFHLLVRTCLRRITALERAYGDGDPQLDYAGLIKRAEKIKTEKNELRWQNLHRWSNRQKKKISLSGIGGLVTYQGDLGEFMPILNYGSRVNIGKQTVFGLGKMDVA